MDEIFDVIIKPVTTEKAVRLIEYNNTLCFLVNKKATKSDIKKAVEEYFKVKVVNVNTYVDRNGKKKAYVRLSQEHVAMDVATQLGLM